MSKKIDRSKWDHDVAGDTVPARDLIAGDLVAGLGILDAIIAEPDGSLLLCSEEYGRRYEPDQEVDVHGAICPDCDMHPLDCDEHGCGESRMRLVPSAVLDVLVNAATSWRDELDEYIIPSAWETSAEEAEACTAESAAIGQAIIAARNTETEG